MLNPKKKSSTRDSGDSKFVMGTFRGGRRKSRQVVSRRVVVREVQAPQKTPPHLRQWWRRSMSENVILQKKLSQ